MSSYPEVTINESLRVIPGQRNIWRRSLKVSKKTRQLKASKTFNVSQATIPVRFKLTFEEAIELQLVEHTLHFEQRFFGFNTTDDKKLAYQFAKQAGLSNRFDKVTEMAGWDWIKKFRQHNPCISLKVPKATSAARARAFNQPLVMKFFDLLTYPLKILILTIWEISMYGCRPEVGIRRRRVGVKV